MKNILLLTAILLFTSNAGNSKPLNGWTIMYYAAGSNSSEEDLMRDIGEMMAGKQSQGYEVICLIDRIEGFSNDAEVLGENFTDTRLYKLGANTYERLEGKEILPEIKKDGSFEANMGDAKLLQQFILYCKKYFPAKHYMLVMRSHGNGVSMCPDRESGVSDKIFPAELTEVLTKAESVDILGLDVCSMAGLENMYEWRSQNNSFSADYVIASAPPSGAWAYDHIFSRLQAGKSKNSTEESNHFTGGLEAPLDPNTMSPLEFSKLIMEEIYDSQRWSSWGLFDNTAIEPVKERIDELAKLLVKEDKAAILKIIEETLSYYHNAGDDLEMAQLVFPYVDAYDFYHRIAEHANMSEESRSKAKAVCAAIDKFVLMSYYGEGYLPETNDFVEGRNGVFQIVPLGHKVFSKSGMTFWAHTGWFSPKDLRQEEDSYGLYDWCANGSKQGSGEVSNFYEYLDYLFGKSSAANPPSNPDSLAVAKACMDYIEGFYEGDTLKIINCMQPRLHKFGFWKNRKTNEYEDDGYMTFEQAKAYAKKVHDNKKPARADAPKVVEVLDIMNHIASAKITAWWGTDYILLSRNAGKWMIEQVLWEGPLEKK